MFPRSIDNSVSASEDSSLSGPDVDVVMAQSDALVAIDDVGIAAGIGQIPSMKKIKSGLENRGFKMAHCQMPEPMFATDADWETVLEVVRSAE